MLRPLLDDVAEDDMCGVTVGKTFAATERFHSLLLRASAGIPDVRSGDSVWWHCDMIHSVAPVQDQQGGATMYIPAAPWCPCNGTYAAEVRRAFEAGDSPSDFPAEGYEAQWPDRFATEQLNETGPRPRPRLSPTSPDPNLPDPLQSRGGNTRVRESAARVLLPSTEAGVSAQSWE